ncbi:MAG TPA: hypothetical protein VNZ22_04405, partial [Bacillota bacterium]|nr:hypothetical protein [Bacillota bacterium]
MPGAEAAGTDGKATFSVTLTDPPGNYAKRVDAFWVTDGAGKFIQNLRKDAATRQGYLYKWAAARGANTTIDGYSGATISTWTPMTVTWDCRDTNNVVVPDGTYKLYVEFTDFNGQGPWTTNGIAFVKGPAALTNTYPDQPYIKSMTVIYTPAHDLAVTGISPSIVSPDTNGTVRVAVTNKTDTAETCSVTLSNVSSASLIGTQTIGPLAGHTITNVAFPWNTTNLLGNYSLQAQAGPVAGETATADNTVTATVTVQVISHDIALTSLTPSLVAPTNNATVYVGVTNETANTESFSVVLSNLTTLSQIGSQTITALGGNKSTNLAFTWNTSALQGSHLLKVTAGPVSGESGTADNTLSNPVMVRPLLHDVAIGAFGAPSLVASNSSASLTVVATNLGEVTESFSVQLFDDTAARSIGPTYQLTHLAAAAATNLPFTWTTTNSALGYHTLRAVATPVWGESARANNTNVLQVPVANGWGSSTLLAKGSTWRYNDQGLDLTETPWRLPGYYDEVWSQGAGPLGYSQTGQLTNLATRLSWGPDAANKYPTYYCRNEFYADALPASLTLNVRCVDGVALYLNGAELARFNLPGDTLSYTNLASSTVSGTEQYAYFSTNVVATNVALGRNVLAAEVHRADTTGLDLAFDLELIGTVPQFPPNHQVTVVGMTTPGNVLAGDRMPFTVTVTNRGNATENVLVILKNNTTGQILDAQNLTALAPGSSASAPLNWSTLGALSGANSLVAYTVVGGVTNLAGAFTNAVTLSGSGIGSNPVNAVGAIGGRCAALATSGGLLLVGAGATLEVWDAANPAALVKRGAVRLPGLIEGIATSGPYAFVACGQAGVQFVDLSSPPVPVHRSTFNTSGHAYGVAVSGNYLYVADGIAGLRVLNIAAPAAPALVGAYYTEGPARAVALSGTRACVLDQHQGLLILDVATPWAPMLLGACTNFDAGQALALSGTTAYVADANNHFFVVDFANPAAAAVTGSLLLPNLVGQAVALNGTTAYVAAGADGLLLINVAAPAAPALLTTIPLPDQATALAVASSNLYVAEGFAGFQSFDVTSPATPVFQADFPTALRANDVVLTNELAYVAAGEGGLQIFSLTNPMAPARLSRFTGVTN